MHRCLDDAVALRLSHVNYDPHDRRSTIAIVVYSAPSGLSQMQKLCCHFAGQSSPGVVRAKTVCLGVPNGSMETVLQ